MPVRFAQSFRQSSTALTLDAWEAGCFVFDNPFRHARRDTHMAWYAYCITEQQAFQGNTRARRPFLIETMRGINDAPVFGYPSGDFAVIVSDYVPNEKLNQQAVVEHARVVS